MSGRPLLARVRQCLDSSAIFARPRTFHRATRSLTTESSPSQTLLDTYENAQLRSTATEPILNDTFTSPELSPSSPLYQPPPNPFLTTATCTLHSFPDFEPVGTAVYTGDQLLLPLRRDILHRAVVFEGDNTRQGTASTKWRDEIRGSSHKLRPQKGTGKARLGDRGSPMLRGGGVTFGPKPRDFGTKLPAKIYDLAWRTALSYRYRRGQLILVDGLAEIERSGPGSSRWMSELLSWHKLDKPYGRSLFITGAKRKNLYAALEGEDMGKHARALPWDDVDVKDLLETGRLVIEREALQKILRAHA